MTVSQKFLRLLFLLLASLHSLINRCSENRHSCLVLGITGKRFNVSPQKDDASMPAVGFS